MKKISRKRKLERLIVPHGMTREIAQILGITERTVYSAINGNVTGEKSAKARKLAELKLKEHDND